MNKLVMTMAMVMTIAMVSAQENLIKNGDAGEGIKGWKGITKVVDGGKSEQCFEVDNMQMVTYIPMISIDPKASYNLSASFKSGNSKVNNVCLGLRFFDQKGRFIPASAVTPVKDSETVMTKAAKKGEKTVFVKDASAWMPLVKIKRAQIVFEVDDSGAYNDLPNNSFIYVDAIEKDGEGYKLTLQKPLPKEMPVNTKVRCHSQLAHYMYAVRFKKNLKEWTTFGGDIKSEIASGSPANAIWRGAKFARVVILANWGQRNAGEVLLIDDVALTKNK